MGFRFRKSVNIGGARVNFSKSGIGASVGGKGFRYTKKADGSTRTTASVPGTGISYQKDSKKKSVSKATSGAVAAVPASPNFLLFWILFRVLSIPLIALGALLALVEPVIGLAAAAFGVGCWVAASHYKKKHKGRKPKEITE